MADKITDRKAPRGKLTGWEINPTLEINPKFDKNQILAFLTKLCQPIQEPSEPKKKDLLA